MIAVFGDNREFRMIRCYPRKQFNIIRGVESISGVRWEGVIFLHGWKQITALCEARDLLEVRQPELFK
jgi:hypothetical protein